MTAKINLTTAIRHYQPEEDNNSWARLAILANGEEMNFQDIGLSDFVTEKKILDTRQSLAMHLYYNPHYTQYQDALYFWAFPFGE